MSDLSKLRIALCQVEAVQGHPSVFEQSTRQLAGYARSTGANLVVFPGETPRLVGMNGGIVAQEGDRATLALGEDLYRIALGVPAEDCDFAVMSDWTPWSLKRRESSAASCGIPIVYANPVGITNEERRVLVYDGASCILSADGIVLSRLRDDFTGDFAPATLTAPGPQAPQCDKKLLRALVSGIQRFDAQVLPWQPKWIIGLSGGLDSGVVAALLVMAFGPERVIAYNLATRYNSDATKANAASLALELGIELRNGSIEQLVDATAAVASQYGYPEGALQGLALENVQARVRGHLLSTFAALEGGVVANNGNRVEASLGYATLYGDSIGALAPIADLTKVQVIGLAHDINELFGKEVVPMRLLPVETQEGFEWETMPSAELADGQRDPMKWFYHDWLVSELCDVTALDPCPIMERYADGSLLDSEMGKWLRFYGLDDPKAFIDDLEWVLSSMRKSAFKRIQAPPSLRVASPATTARSSEIQGGEEPSERYLELKKSIL